MLSLAEIESLWDRFYELADRRHRPGLSMPEFTQTLERAAKVMWEEQMNKPWSEAQEDSRGHYRALAYKVAETLLRGWGGREEEG